MARALARQARYRLETSQGRATPSSAMSAAAVRAARRAGEARVEAGALRVLAVHLGQRGRSTAGARRRRRSARAVLSRPWAMMPPPGRNERARGRSAERALRVAVLLLAKGADPPADGRVRKKP